MAEAEAASTWRHVLQFYKSALIFTIVYNKLKNDLRLPLTSQIKELGAILQKLIKFEPGNDSGSKNETNETKTRWLGVVGDADALGPAVFGVGLGAAALTKRIGNEICSLARTRKMRKESRFSLCLDG